MGHLLVPVIAALLLLAGCGSEGPGEGAGPPEPATLLLDFTPNAVHAGIYAATTRGHDRRAGVRLRVRPPASSTDAVKLLLGGRAELAVLDIHDLALARARGRDVVGVMALVQRPLAAVLARPGVRTPRDLEGERVGVTGLPSDEAVLASVVRGAGGDPARVRPTTIGFTAVPSVLSGKVAGATAFWNVEGVALRERGGGRYREFRVDDFGAPAYPELVLAVSRATLRGRPELVRAAVRALARGYRDVVADPAAGVRALERGARLSSEAVRPQLDAVLGAFTFGSGPVGELDGARLRAWARWERRFGIVAREPDVARAFDGRFVPRGGS